MSTGYCHGFDSGSVGYTDWCGRHDREKQELELLARSAWQQWLRLDLARWKIGDEAWCIFRRTERGSPGRGRSASAPAHKLRFEARKGKVSLIHMPENWQRIHDAMSGNPTSLLRHVWYEARVVGCEGWTFPVAEDAESAAREAARRQAEEDRRHSQAGRAGR